jgi:hypothetical protein
MAVYTDEQLIYAARARCRCGAGLAYPNDGNVRGSWSCSAVLKGADPAVHDNPLPFTFYEIKSEFSSIEGDATTRPSGKIDRERIEIVPEKSE